MSAASGLIRRLGEAGASAEIIAIAVEAVEAVVEDRRAADRERKRRQRHGMSRDVTGQSVTSRDPYPPKNTNQPSLPTIENLQTPYPPPIVPRPSKFDTFWAEYPNKVGKRAAEASFAKALKRASLAEITDGLGRARLSKAWADADFIPHPATWLNQDRWTDQPAKDGVVVPIPPPRTQAEKDVEDQRILAEGAQRIAQLTAKIAADSHIPSAGRNGSGLRGALRG